jgi:hypothetical protein
MPTIAHRPWTVVLLTLWLSLLLPWTAQAGSLTNLSMTPANNTISATSNYTLTFRAPSILNNTRVLRVNNAAGAGGNTSFQGVTLQSVSGGTLTMNIGLAASTELFFNITGGTAAANTTITIVVVGVTNPNQSNGNGYFVQVEDANTFNDIDTGTAPGNTYVTPPGPFLTLALPNYSNREAQSGQFIGVADLNGHFADGDGDPLTFSISGNTLPAVAGAQIVGNSLRITPLSFGTTTITVQASDNAEGTASGSFTVGALGFLQSASVTPADPVVGRTSNYTIGFIAQTAIGSGDFVILQHASGGPDQSASSLQSISGGLTAMKTAGGTNFTTLQITGGSVAPGNSVSIVLAGLVNPAVVSTGPDYLIEKTNGVSSQDRARLPGTSYQAPPVLIFANGFE